MERPTELLAAILCLLVAAAISVGFVGLWYYIIIKFIKFAWGA